jgi:DNA helicase-2/ATP-dependent DNA helicase PcrA
MRTAARLKGLPAAESISPFIEEMLLKGPADTVELEADKVKIMTIHTSKGLEFETVFITGVEDGLLPLRLSGSVDMEEERRLFYVGMTRARENAYLLNASKRMIWGTVHAQRPSPFIKEIPPGLIRRTVVTKKKKTRRAVQNALFE